MCFLSPHSIYVSTCKYKDDARVLSSEDFALWLKLYEVLHCLGEELTFGQEYCFYSSLKFHRSTLYIYNIYLLIYTVKKDRCLLNYGNVLLSRAEIFDSRFHVTQLFRKAIAFFFLPILSLILAITERSFVIPNAISSHPTLWFRSKYQLQIFNWILSAFYLLKSSI